MKKVIALLGISLATTLFAISPFSLEGLKAVNITLLNKSALLPEPFVQSLEKELAQKLQAQGIQTSARHFSNLLIKVQHHKSGQSNLCYVSLSLVENGTFVRSSPIEAIAVSFTKDDLFECEEIQRDVAESISYLLDEFIDQYKEENKLSKK